MPEWTTRALGELADIRISNVDKKSVAGEKPVRLCNYMDAYANDYIRSDIDFMEATASASEIARFSVVAGDVVLTKDSETPDDIGIPAVVMDQIDNLVCGYHLALLKTKQELIDPVFLCKQLSTSRAAQYFGQRATGSTRYGLPNRALATFQIPVPPLAVQKTIACVLQAIDTAIEKTEALIAKHQQIKAGLMHDLFTRGVLPNGQLRPPRSEAPELYQETALGWLPLDWALSRIGHAFEIQLGKMLNQAARGGGSSFPYLANRSVQWNKVEVSALEEMDFSPTEREKFSLLPDDLLVCEGGEVGRTAIWANQLDNCYYQKAIHRLRAKDSLVHPRYMLHFMWRAKTAGLFENFTSQTSIAHLTQEKLAQIPMAVPVPNEQRRVFERLDAVDRLIERDEAVRLTLQKQKLGLMQDLLTGRVPVPVREPEPVHA